MTFGDFEYELINSGIMITKYRALSTSANIPKKIADLPVTSIGYMTFHGCSSLTSVVIPDSITSIGDRAFEGCGSLTGIVIPDSVTSIGDHAFYGCSALTNVVIPDSVTSIGDGAFGDCKSLTSIVIPDSVTSIGDGAFGDCKSLTSIVIPDSVTSIGGSAFYGCKSLTSIVIPNSVTSIGGSVFYGCKSLTSIVIPNSVTSIGGSVFRKCESLKTIYFPRALMDVNGRDNTLKDFRNEYNDKIRYYNTVSEIKELMESPDFEKENVSNSDFKYTRTRSGIQIDKYVGQDSFVAVPEEIEGLPVTTIGYRAFDNENLYKVIIPASVKTIVFGAFNSKQSMHVLFKGKSIQLTAQSFLAPRIIFYFIEAIIYDDIYKITKNNSKYIISYNAKDFHGV